MVGQANLHIAVEDIHDLDRQLHSLTPRRHRQRESFPRHRKLGPRWRLNLSQFQRSETLRQQVDQQPGIDILLDFFCAERHHGGVLSCQFSILGETLNSSYRELRTRNRELPQISFPAARSFTSPRSASRKSRSSNCCRVTQRISRNIRFSISPWWRRTSKNRNSTAPPPGYSWTIRATSTPTSASIPSSSSNSRRMASRGCSPSSIFPPGNSHFSGIG